ncbi:MAG: hypothetical protein KCHDKBKB_01474 [Elusimicrobia bacterium]|nr:hypothetical protein [Elusimicrobiota bacterium]
MKSVRFIATVLIPVYLATNCLFAYAPENNFWKERQKKIELASLPADAINKFPSLPYLQKAISSRVSAKKVERWLRNGTSNSKLKNVLLALSSQAGSIRDVSLPPNNTPGSSEPSQKIVVHIQDIHMNQEAQQNIGAAILGLVQKKSVDLVALEGAFEPIDLTPYQTYPHQDSVQKVADYLLRENKISGPVHALMTSPSSPQILGIDDSLHHATNVEAYRQSAKIQAIYSKQIQNLKIEYRNRKAKMFNTRLWQFDQKVDAYREGKIEMGDYAEHVAGFKSGLNSDLPFSIATFLEALRLERSLDYAQVEHERSLLLSQLLKKLDKAAATELMETGLALCAGDINHSDFYQYLNALCESNGIQLRQFRRINDYLHYVLLAETIEAEDLLRDLKDLEEKIYTQLIQTAGERALIKISHDLYLTGKLVDFSLTPEEWREYKMTTLREKMFPSLRQSRGRGTLGLESFEQFYQQAELRDKAIANNLSQAITHKNVNVAVLVTGGFHAQGIKDVLQRSSTEQPIIISFVPKITQVQTDNGSATLSVFTQQKTPLDQLFEGQKLYLANHPAIAQRAGGKLLATFEATRGRRWMQAAVSHFGLNNKAEPVTHGRNKHAYWTQFGPERWTIALSAAGAIAAVSVNVLSPKNAWGDHFPPLLAQIEPALKNPQAGMSPEFAFWFLLILFIAIIASFIFDRLVIKKNRFLWSRGIFETRESEISKDLHSAHSYQSLSSFSFMQNLAVFLQYPTRLISHFIFGHGEGMSILLHFVFISVTLGAFIYSVFWFNNFLKLKRMESFYKPKFQNDGEENSSNLMSLTLFVPIALLGSVLTGAASAPQIKWGMVTAWLCITAFIAYLTYDSGQFSLPSTKSFFLLNPSFLKPLYRFARIILFPINAVLGIYLVVSFCGFAPLYSAVVFLSFYSILEYIQNYVFQLSSAAYGLFFVGYPFHVLNYILWGHSMPTMTLRKGVIGKTLGKKSSNSLERASPSRTDAALAKSTRKFVVPLVKALFRPLEKSLEPWFGQEWVDGPGTTAAIAALWEPVRLALPYLLLLNPFGWETIHVYNAVLVLQLSNFVLFWGEHLEWKKGQRLPHFGSWNQIGILALLTIAYFALPMLCFFLNPVFAFGFAFVGTLSLFHWEHDKHALREPGGKTVGSQTRQHLATLSRRPFFMYAAGAAIASFLPSGDLLDAQEKPNRDPAPIKVTVQRPTLYISFQYSDIDFDHVARVALKRLLEDFDLTETMYQELVKRGLHINIVRFEKPLFDQVTNHLFKSTKWRLCYHLNEFRIEINISAGSVQSKEDLEDIIATAFHRDAFGYLERLMHDGRSDRIKPYLGLIDFIESWGALFITGSLVGWSIKSKANKKGVGPSSRTLALRNSETFTFTALASSIIIVVFAMYRLSTSYSWKLDWGFLNNFVNGYLNDALYIPGLVGGFYVILYIIRHTLWSTETSKSPLFLSHLETVYRWGLFLIATNTLINGLYQEIAQMYDVEFGTGTMGDIMVYILTALFAYVLIYHAPFKKLSKTSVVYLMAGFTIFIIGSYIPGMGSALAGAFGSYLVGRLLHRPGAKQDRIPTVQKSVQKRLGPRAAPVLPRRSFIKISSLGTLGWGAALGSSGRSIIQGLKKPEPRQIEYLFTLSDVDLLEALSWELQYADQLTADGHRIRALIDEFKLNYNRDPGSVAIPRKGPLCQVVPRSGRPQLHINFPLLRHYVEEAERLMQSNPSLARELLNYVKGELLAQTYIADNIENIEHHIKLYELLQAHHENLAAYPQHKLLVRTIISTELEIIARSLAIQYIYLAYQGWNKEKCEQLAHLSPNPLKGIMSQHAVDFKALENTNIPIGSPEWIYLLKTSIAKRLYFPHLSNPTMPIHMLVSLALEWEIEEGKATRDPNGTINIDSKTFDFLYVEPGYWDGTNAKKILAGQSSKVNGSVEQKKDAALAKSTRKFVVPLVKALFRPLEKSLEPVFGQEWVDGPGTTAAIAALWEPVRLSLPYLLLLNPFGWETIHVYNAVLVLQLFNFVLFWGEHLEWKKGQRLPHFGSWNQIGILASLTLVYFGIPPLVFFLDSIFGFAFPFVVACTFGIPLALCHWDHDYQVLKGLGELAPALQWPVRIHIDPARKLTTPEGVDFDFWGLFPNLEVEWVGLLNKPTKMSTTTGSDGSEKPRKSIRIEGLERPYEYPISEWTIERIYSSGPTDFEGGREEIQNMTGEPDGDKFLKHLPWLIRHLFRDDLEISLEDQVITAQRVVGAMRLKFSSTTGVHARIFLLLHIFVAEREARDSSQASNKYAEFINRLKGALLNPLNAAQRKLLRDELLTVSQREPSLRPFIYSFIPQIDQLKKVTPDLNQESARQFLELIVTFGRDDESDENLDDKLRELRVAITPKDSNLMSWNKPLDSTRKELHKASNVQWVILLRDGDSVQHGNFELAWFESMAHFSTDWVIENPERYLKNLFNWMDELDIETLESDRLGTIEEFVNSHIRPNTNLNDKLTMLREKLKVPESSPDQPSRITTALRFLVDLQHVRQKNAARIEFVKKFWAFEKTAHEWRSRKGKIAILTELDQVDWNRSSYEGENARTFIHLDSLAVYPLTWFNRTDAIAHGAHILATQYSYGWGEDLETVGVVVTDEVRELSKKYNVDLPENCALIYVTNSGYKGDGGDFDGVEDPTPDPSTETDPVVDPRLVGAPSAFSLLPLASPFFLSQFMSIVVGQEKGFPKVPTSDHWVYGIVFQLIVATLAGGFLWFRHVHHLARAKESKLKRKDIFQQVFGGVEPVGVAGRYQGGTKGSRSNNRNDKPNKNNVEGILLPSPKKNLPTGKEQRIRNSAA